MKKLPTLALLFTCFSSPLWSIVIKPNNDLAFNGGGGLGGNTLVGVVEVITEPTPVFEELTGSFKSDRFGHLEREWDVLMTVDEEQDLDFPGKETVWLHAKLPQGSSLNQFIGWEGIDDTLTNPVEVSLSEVDSISAHFEGIPQVPSYYLPESPTSSVWVQSNGQGLVELITEPAPVLDEEAGKPSRDERGYIVRDWDVIITIHARKEINLPNEQKIWLHAAPIEGYQFAGWTGIDDKLTNPVEITLAEANLVVATFEEIPGSEPKPMVEPLSSVWIKSKNALGVVEVITTPQITIDINTGTELLDDAGNVVHWWNVLKTIQNQREIHLPNEQTIWLHASPKEGSQFTGWVGIQETLENPVEVTLSEVEEITATFEETTELEKREPFIVGWFWSQDMNGWFYTNKELYPFLWSNTDQSWWRYEKTVGKQRYFSKFGNPHAQITIIFE